MPCENCRNTRSEGGYVGAKVMDLSKVFKTLDHNLLIANEGANGFREDTLTYMKNHLSNRLHRFPVNGSLSSWDKIFSRVRQGSILGLYFLIIYFFLQQTPTSGVMIMSHTIVL